VAAPNKKARTKEETTTAEVVKAQTWSDQATTLLESLLKDAADARKASIKLANMEYAKELSQNLLAHAQKLEAQYTEMSSAIARGADEKSLKALVGKANELLAYGAKAQAHCLCKILCYLFFATKAFQQNGISIGAQPSVNFNHLWL